MQNILITCIMKIRFIKMRQLLITALAGLLGVNYGCDSIAADYGCPEADFDISGHVTDKEGNPIEGIEVKHIYRSDTTDADGYYHIPKHGDFPDAEVPIDFRDADGDEHGAYRDTTMIVKVKHSEYRGSNDWYEGTLTKEVNVTLEEKTDK